VLVRQLGRLGHVTFFLSNASYRYRMYRNGIHGLDMGFDGSKVEKKTEYNLSTSIRDEH
jgi:hypothetical protein